MSRKIIKAFFVKLTTKMKEVTTFKQIFYIENDFNM